MKLESVLKSTNFERYIDVFASKGYYTVEELQTLENDPEKYIRVLSEVEPDDLKMVDLFSFLKTAGENQKKEAKEYILNVAAETRRKKRRSIMILLKLVAFLVIAFIPLYIFNLNRNPKKVVKDPPVVVIPNIPNPPANPPEIDSDEDGVLDVDDDCVYYFGPIENNGCPWPDTDGDGIYDQDDYCVSDYGPEENNGCPWPDSDNDGVLDKDDDCISYSGPEENNGCPWPDSDNDGVLDKDDDCVNKYGPKNNNGCPWPDYDNDGVFTAAKHSFKITNRAGRNISFYLKVDGGSWEQKTLKNKDYNIYNYSKSSIKWWLETSGHSPVIYDINSAEEYVIEWNKSKGVWDLFQSN